MTVLDRCDCFRNIQCNECHLKITGKQSFALHIYIISFQKPLIIRDGTEPGQYFPLKVSDHKMSK